MVKLLVGFLKGAVIGGGLGYGAYALGQSTGFESAWLTYGLVGVFVGLLVGKPIWSMIRDQSSTTVVSLLKAAFGFGVGCGLYALIAKVWNPSLDLAGVPGGNVFAFPPVIGGAIGAVYGGFVEVDDSIGDGVKVIKPKPEPKQLPAKPPAKK